MAKSTPDRQRGRSTAGGTGSRPDWIARIVGYCSGAQRDPVLFYAERDSAILFGAWGATVATMLPFGLAVPQQFLSGICLSFGALLICWRTFRFELTSRSLTYRPNAFAMSVTVPLPDVRMVLATDLLGRPDERSRSEPRRGHLLVRTDAQLIVVKSIREPHEAARAVETLKRQAERVQVTPE